MPIPFVHRLGAGALAGAMLAAAPLGATSVLASVASSTDVRVTTDSSYTKANGSPITSGDAIAQCGGNRRQQNEPRRQSPSPAE